MEENRSPAKQFAQAFLKLDAKRFGKTFLKFDAWCISTRGLKMRGKSKGQKRNTCFFGKTFFSKEKFCF